MLVDIRGIALREVRHLRGGGGRRRRRQRRHGLHGRGGQGPLRRSGGEEGEAAAGQGREAGVGARVWGRRRTERSGGGGGGEGGEEEWHNTGDAGEAGFVAELGRGGQHRALAAPGTRRSHRGEWLSRLVCLSSVMYRVAACQLGDVACQGLHKNLTERVT